MQMPEAQANLLGQADTEKREGAEKKGEKDDDSKLGEREWQCMFATSIMLPMLVPVDQSNYKSISVKLGDNIKSGGYWKWSAPDWQWQIKWTQ